MCFKKNNNVGSNFGVQSQSHRIQMSKLMKYVLVADVEKSRERLGGGVNREDKGELS